MRYRIRHLGLWGDRKRRPDQVVEATSPDQALHLAITGRHAWTIRVDPSELLAVAEWRGPRRQYGARLIATLLLPCECGHPYPATEACSCGRPPVHERVHPRKGRQ